MAPDHVIGLSRPVREALHFAAWCDALVRPSLMPYVPPQSTGASAVDIKARVDAAAWRNAVEANLFPPDEPKGSA